MPPFEITPELRARALALSLLGLNFDANEKDIINAYNKKVAQYRQGSVAAAEIKKLDDAFFLLTADEEIDNEQPKAKRFKAAQKDRTKNKDAWWSGDEMDEFASRDHLTIFDEFNIGRASSLDSDLPEDFMIFQAGEENHNVTYAIFDSRIVALKNMEVMPNGKIYFEESIEVEGKFYQDAASTILDGFDFYRNNHLQITQMKNSLFEDGFLPSNSPNLAIKKTENSIEMQYPHEGEIMAFKIVKNGDNFMLLQSNAMQDFNERPMNFSLVPYEKYSQVMNSIMNEIDKAKSQQQELSTHDSPAQEQFDSHAQKITKKGLVSYVAKGLEGGSTEKTWVDRYNEYQQAQAQSVKSK